MSRFFHISEARSLLPFVGRTLREAAQASERHAAAERYLQDLARRIILMGGISVDTAAVENWKQQLESSDRVLQAALARIDEAGVLIKDLATGLVDFPTMFLGEEVYLCWRMDEDDIGHWHGVHEGFAGRREIDSVFLDNHRGSELA